MIPFTVLLLYPDYAADTFGQDTYLAYVHAVDAEEAVTKARDQVRVADQDPFDFHCLFSCIGFHVNLEGMVRL